MKKLGWRVSLGLLILVGFFLMGIITVVTTPESQKQKKESLPRGAWRVNKAGLGCRSQEVFLELVRNFDRYDQASATGRMRDSLERKRDDRRYCILFNPGEVVYIREIDKWLKTVWLDREKDNDDSIHL